MFGKDRIGCLGGLRGLAALWVLIGHAHILAGFHIPIIGNPDLGVDLFILISGFLMVFQYRLRESREPWNATSTWKSFWIRRLFRIAPLYYVMLAAALALGPVIYEARMVIDTYNGVAPQPASRYLDQSLWNVLTHITFIFGAIPDYAYRTALPDWSIGLEMQFYLVLPFIMLLIKRVGIVTALSVVVTTGISVAVLSIWLGYKFPMPAFLPLKMHVFAAGMILGFALKANNTQAWTALIAAIVLIVIPIGGKADITHQLVRMALVFGFFALVEASRFPGYARDALLWVSEFFSQRGFSLLGEFSYGAYLVHLLIMQPVVAYLIRASTMDDVERWGVTLLITIPLTYLIAAAGYFSIEKPGQMLGRRAA